MAPRSASGPDLPATDAMGACLIPGKRALSPGSPLPCWPGGQQAWQAGAASCRGGCEEHPRAAPT